MIAAAVLVADGLRDDLGKADAALVLGNTVSPQGIPSDRLKARLDRTISLYREGYFRKIIASGGVGKEGYPEGTAMADYLVSQGIPRENILVDNLGIDTWASARNTKKILDLLNLKTVLVVSQYFHVPRSRLALTQAGIATVYTAHAYYFEPRDLYSISREVPAWFKYLLRPEPGVRESGPAP